MFHIIQEIANESKTNGKIELLNKQYDNEEFKKILRYTLDPNKLFGIIPDTSWIKVTGNDHISPTTFDLLDRLVERSITGNMARNALQEHIDTLTKEDAELLIRIIRKDLRAGCSISTVNKVWSGFIEQPTYMRCTTYSKKTYEKWDYSVGIYSQYKMDGLFLNANVTNNITQFVTRQGSIIDSIHLDNISKELSILDGMQLHGELVMFKDGKPLPREESNGIANSIAQGGELDSEITPMYIVWDMIPKSEARKNNTYQVKYKDRFAKLESITNNMSYVNIVEYKLFYNIEDCFAHAIKLIKQGIEGTVMKTANMYWKHGTSKDQVKIKVEAVSEFKIIGAKLGAKDSKYENVYATIQCVTEDEKLSVDVVIKNDKMRKAINDDLSDWIGKIVSIVYNNISIDFETGKQSLY